MGKIMSFQIHHLSRNIIFPEFYFSGNRHMKSDREFISQCLMFMSDENKKMACEHYRDLYLRKGRKAANIFLRNFSVEFGVTREEYNQAQVDAGGLNQKFRDKIEELKKLKKGRISIISMAEATAKKPDETGLTQGLQAKRRRRQWSTFQK